MTYNEHKKLLFALIRSVMSGESVPSALTEGLTESDISAICELAQRYDIGHIIATALLNLRSLNIKDQYVIKELKQQQAIAIYRYEHQQYALDEICALFEKEKIDYIPLKGAILRNYYPEPWMRTSCDIDILIRLDKVENAVQLLTEKLKYRNVKKGEHDISLYSEYDVHLELHFSLMDEGANTDEVFSNVWEASSLKEGYSHLYLLNDELQYLYHVAHMARHMSYGGCGIRPFIDLWVLNMIPHDDEKRDELLCAVGLKQFELASKKLSSIWIAGAEHDRLSLAMEKYILAGGTYGTNENQMLLERARHGSKLKYMLSRIFLPYDSLKKIYPILNKRRILTPIYEVFRWFTFVFRDSKSRKYGELSASKESLDDLSLIIDNLGI